MNWVDPAKAGLPFALEAAFVSYGCQNAPPSWNSDSPHGCGRLFRLKAGRSENQLPDFPIQG